MSMPDEIFLNSHASVITCVIVVKAKVSHNSSISSYFDYWKDDGFTKLKYKGRVDLGAWNHIKETWIDSYYNKIEIPGLSVMSKVSAVDEWCAEAYMETDYELIKEDIFTNQLLKYSSYMFTNKILTSINDKAHNSDSLNINLSNWEFINIKDYFTVGRGKEKAVDTISGTTPLVMATRENNGVVDKILDSRKLFKGHCLTVVGNGVSTGESFYQRENFYASVDVMILRYKGKINVFSLVFISNYYKTRSI